MQDKVAIVSGAAGSVGIAAGQALAAAGAALVLIGPHQVQLAEAVVELHALGASVVGVGGDAANEGVARRAVAVALQEFGRLDALVCADFSFTGAFFLAKHGMPALKEQGEGAIVTVAAGGTHARGGPGALAVPPASDSVVALTRVLALDYARAGIRCNGLWLYDAGEAAPTSAAQLAAAVIRLCARGSTAGGEILPLAWPGLHTSGRSSPMDAVAAGHLR